MPHIEENFSADTTPGIILKLENEVFFELVLKIGP
jgi:hypothetical protein